MCFELILCLLFAMNVDSKQWDGYHRQFDDELPTISWKNCGQSVIKCDPSTIPKTSTRIQGGEEAFRGEFPWFTLLKIIKGPVTESCGGSIINEWWVLTAAHCIQNIETEIDAISVAIGTDERFQTQGVGRYVVVEKVVMHKTFVDRSNTIIPILKRFVELNQQLEEWEINDKPRDKEFDKLYQELVEAHELYTFKRFQNNYYYNIALLKVKDRIVPIFNSTHYTVNSICLPKPDIINTQNENLMVIGMGSQSMGGYLSKHLRKAVNLMLDQQSCKDIHYNKFNEQLEKPLICLKTTNRSSLPLFNSSICTGDYGGPSHQYMGWQAIQIGITILAYPGSKFCADVSQSTRVSAFMPWIRSYVSGINFTVEADTNHTLIVFVIILAILSVAICSLIIWVLASNLRK